MNKQELLEKIKALKPDEQCLHEYQPEEWEAFQDGFDDGKCYVELIIEQLDEPVRPPEPKLLEPEKLYTVELPNPNGGTHLVLCKDCDGKLFIETFLIDDWESFGKCKLTEAEIKKEFSWTWQFAKELEDKDQEEKLYTVEFPNPNSDNHLVLRKNFDGKVCVSLLHSEYWRGNESTRLTEAEIKECFNWAWQFAKEVEND